MTVPAAGPGVLDIGGFAQGFVSALTDVDTVQKEYLLGMIRRENNGFYKYVQFGATRTGQVTASLAPGDVVCYVLGTTLDLNKLTLVDSANSAVGAGVVMGTIPATGGPYFGWIMVLGTTTLDQAIGGTTPAAGNEVTTTAATAKTVTKRAAVTDMAIGIVIDLSISATPLVNINFPF